MGWFNEAEARELEAKYGPATPLKGPQEAVQQPRQLVEGDLQCVVCRIMFHVPPSYLKKGHQVRYCSLKCRTEAWQKQGHPSWRGGEVACQCQTCGKEVLRKKSHVSKTSRGNFCSSECHNNFSPKVSRTCQQCSKSFLVHPSRLKNGGGLFCGKACKTRNKAKSNNCSCLVCGVAFHRKPCDLSRGDGEGKNAGSFCSMECKAHWMSGHPYTSKGKTRHPCNGGKRSDLGGLYVRSSWEANWARYLSWLKGRGGIANWEYEPQTFEFVSIKKGSRFYTPDFKITENDGTIVWHEVKGWLDPKSKTKLKRMAKYFPEIDLRLIQKREYDAVRKTVSKIIPNWE